MPGIGGGETTVLCKQFSRHKKRGLLIQVAISFDDGQKQTESLLRVESMEM